MNSRERANNYSNPLLQRKMGKLEAFHPGDHLKPGCGCVSEDVFHGVFS